MKTVWNNYRYLIMRRVVQVGLLFLYFGGNAWGWTILRGNLSSSRIFDMVPMSDPYAALQMLAAGVLLASDLLIGVAVATVFYLLIGGRVFCSWVCPVNMITDAAAWLREKLEINRVQNGKVPISRNMRYWVLGLSLVISAAMGVAAFEFISPISMVHRGPLGGFYTRKGRFSLIRVHHDEEACTLCMKCKVICPEPQVLYMVGKETIPVLSGECTNCARCIEVCDDDALGFSIRKLVDNKTTGDKDESNK
jgi:ferredoxin-type protein NapH